MPVLQDIWKPNFWIPAHIDWKDIAKYTNLNDLWIYTIPLSITIIILRYKFLNNYIYEPAASYFGLKNIKFANVSPNEMLEIVFIKNKWKIPYQDLISCSEKLNWPPRQVERWVRQRYMSTSVSKYNKFTECCFQLTHYIFIFTYGVIVMYNKPWIYDLNKSWKDYPNHPISRDVWWYYMLSLSYYWTMIITLLFETKRNDFWQMLLHHFITVFLISFSWACNVIRMGCIILILHDISDIPLLGAKICIYIKKKFLCNALFVIFCVIWIITRLIIFPGWIIHSILFKSTNYIPICHIYYVMSSLILLLFCLHLYWSYIIMQTVCIALYSGRVDDDRSDSDLTDIEDRKER